MAATMLKHQQADLKDFEQQVSQMTRTQKRSRDQDSGRVEFHFPDPRKSGWVHFAKQYCEIAKDFSTDHSAERGKYLEFLDSLTTEELIATLDEINSTSFDDDPAKDLLERTLASHLNKKSPELLLDYALKAAAKGHRATFDVLQTSLEEFAATSPEKAITWLDSLIEKEGFNYKGPKRYVPEWLKYENSLFLGLLGSRPDLAEARISALPEENRAQVLSYYTSGPIPESLRSTYVNLSRKFMDSDQVLQMVSSMTSQIALAGGNKAVDAFIRSVPTTPKERMRIVDNSLSVQIDFIAMSRPPNLQDVDDLRKWVTFVSANRVDRATGSALGHMVGCRSLTLDQAFEALQGYQEKGGGDTLISGFLAYPVVWSQPERCKELAARIQNENLRKECMSPP